MTLVIEMTEPMLSVGGGNHGPGARLRSSVRYARGSEDERRWQNEALWPDGGHTLERAPSESGP